MRKMCLAAGVALLAQAAPAIAAMSEAEKKLCMVISATRLPPVVGAMITAAKVDDSAPDQALNAMVVVYSWQEINQKYFAFSQAQLNQLVKLPALGPEARKLVAGILGEFKNSAGTAEVTFKAGVIEATYGFTCMTVRGNMMVGATGLVK